MKTVYCLLLLAFVPFGLAQAPASRPPDGGDGFTGPLDEISPEERQFIQTEIEKNRQRLIAEGVLSKTPSTQIVSFAWPLRAAPNLSDPGYHGISNFVDQDPSPLTLDYNCGTRTYNGHQGIDFFTWPFTWYKMDSAQVEIVAAAAGTITLKQDGNFDRSCSTGGGSWNAVFVQHSDNSISWYGHMKNGSTTSKNVGQSVAQGEYLGIVGSSGNSTGPHLHFETYDANNNLIEPYFGACNSLNAQSWWAAQRPYRDSAINALMIHDNLPVFPPCPGQEILNQKNIFIQGETGQFAAYFRDEVTTLTTTLRIRAPNNSVWQTWTHSPPQDFAASWWVWTWVFPSNAAIGTWTFEADYNGQTYTLPFTMVQASDIVFRVERSTGDVYTDGAFIGGGADLAERINVSEPVEPGDVVELDPTKPGFYRKANGSEKFIAGVITTEPGFILGNESTEFNQVSKQARGRPMLALMGRVPVKTTTENGAIRPGDLLTIAGKPGYAMRCVDISRCEGAIIGKALEGLEKGEGLILALVMAH